MVKINLLDNHYRQLVKRQEKARIFNRVAGGILIVTLLAVGITFFIENYYSKQVEAVDDQIRAKEAELAELESVRIDNIMLSERLDLVATILEGREILRDKFSLFFKIFTNKSVSLREVGFGDTTSREQLEIGGSAPTVSHFVDFTNDVDNYVIEDKLDAVLLDTVSRDETGEYRFNYEVDFISTKDRKIDEEET